MLPQGLPEARAGESGVGVILHLGRYQEALADVREVDAVIADPPFSGRVHKGHDAGASLANKRQKVRKANGVNDTTRPRRAISYPPWTPADVHAFIDFWASRNRGWFVCLSDSELCSPYRDAFERNGLTGFQPVPVLIPGMTVRMSGDGPSSWAFYANVARPKRLCRWGTLPGGYHGPLGSRERAAYAVVGAKPLWVMRKLVAHYSRPGDLVVDPCAGGGTTLIAAHLEGRRAIGCEEDAQIHAVALQRIAAQTSTALERIGA